MIVGIIGFVISTVLAYALFVYQAINTASLAVGIFSFMANSLVADYIVDSIDYFHIGKYWKSSLIGLFAAVYIFILSIFKFGVIHLGKIIAISVFVLFFRMIFDSFIGIIPIFLCISYLSSSIFKDAIINTFLRNNDDWGFFLCLSSTLVFIFVTAAPLGALLGEVVKLLFDQSGSRVYIYASIPLPFVYGLYFISEIKRNEII